ncbi:MAG: fibrobacter succinogenes major paralogous domain-containing protein [Haliscomenobacter sp.]|nr:fibrobacter succinogenes major paralogous domain-containing protein [Haliscomenobacter sp.]
MPVYCSFYLVMLSLGFSLGQSGSIKGVKIGAQTWAIQTISTPTIDAFKVPGTNPAEYLYTWDDAKKLAKNYPGWRLPSEADWRKLEKFLGSPESEKENANRTGGDKLKKYKGFNVFPGEVYGDNTLAFSGERAYYWTSTTLPTLDGNQYVIVKALFKDGMKKDKIYHHLTSPMKKYGMKMSVRLIKD